MDLHSISEDTKHRLELAGFTVPSTMEPIMHIKQRPRFLSHDAATLQREYRGNCRFGRSRRASSGESKTTSSYPATAGSFASSSAAHTTPGDYFTRLAAPRSSRSSSSSSASSRYDTSAETPSKLFSPSAYIKSKLHRSNSVSRSPPLTPPSAGPSVIFIECAP